MEFAKMKRLLVAFALCLPLVGHAQQSLPSQATYPCQVGFGCSDAGVVPMSLDANNVPRPTSVLSPAPTSIYDPSAGYGASVKSQGGSNALQTVPSDAVNFNNSTLTNGTVSNGLFSSGTVTNPSASQVIIGPIDTTGAASWNFYLAVTSGSGSTVTVQESQTGAANTWTTVPGLGNGAQTLMTISGMGSNANSQTGAVRQRYLQVVASAATEVLQVSGYLRSAPFVATYSGPTQMAYGATALQTIAVNNNIYALYESSSRYLIVVPYSIPEATWQWSTNGTAITTNTTTTLQAAQAAGVRNYLADFTCDNSGTGAATELQVLDGATVIYDGFIGAASATLNDPHFAVTFKIPLRGTAATAMSLKTLTTGAALFCSAQGYAAY